ncbi:MAG: HAD family phosphatase [Bacteriovoracaceae bacterium]|nr:HAD family phosphatase [Bacteriovoracaceae bacterium]
MSEIKCFIFDLDGTLCSTIEANIEAYRMVFQCHNVPFSQDKYLSCQGMTFPKMIKELAPQISGEIIEKIKISKREEYKKRINLIHPNRPLIEYLKYIKNSYPVGLVTSASRPNAETVLNYLKLIDKFDVKLFADDVVLSKPDPEGYVKCADLLKIRPENCLVFEDSNAGIESAKKAGMKVVKINKF